MTESSAIVHTLPSTSPPALRKTNTATQWLPPVGLILLSLVPVLAGAVRVTELLSSPEIASATAAHLAAFAERVRAGDVAPTAAIHAREILKTVFAAYHSAEEGVVIRLDEPDQAEGRAL